MVVEEEKWIEMHGIPVQLGGKLGCVCVLGDSAKVMYNLPLASRVCLMCSAHF